MDVQQQRERNGPVGSQSALAVAGDLDAKIESLLETAAR